MGPSPDKRIFTRDPDRFMLEANNNPAVIVRPSAAVATIESPCRRIDSLVRFVVIAATALIPPSAAVALIN
jgi:hypothetical protein